MYSIEHNRPRSNPHIISNNYPAASFALALYRNVRVAKSMIERHDCDPCSYANIVSDSQTAVPVEDTIGIQTATVAYDDATAIGL
jgi:hypothetical protein